MKTNKKNAGASPKTIRSNVLQAMFFAAALFVVPFGLGSPFIFDDTAYYYSQGEYFSHQLRIWPRELGERRLRDPTSLMNGSSEIYQKKTLSIMGARSPTYGLFIYLSERIGTIWLFVALQCVVTSWIITLWLRVAINHVTWTNTIFLALLLVSGTSLPFFTGFTMPDIFAALALVCVPLILVYGGKINVSEKIGVLVLLSLAVGFHNATGAIVFATAISGALFLLLQKPSGRSLGWRLGAVVAAVIVGMVPNAALKAFYTYQSGETQRSPPFLMARVLADGPGRMYLNEHCPGGVAPTLCRFSGNRIRTETDFLWSQVPHVGVISMVGPDLEMRLRQEEGPFVIAALKGYPIVEVGAAFKNWEQQLLDLYVLEPTIDPTFYSKHPFWSRTSLPDIIPKNQADQPLAGQILRFPAIMLLFFQVLVLFGTSALAGYAVIASDRRLRETEHFKLLAHSVALIVLGVLANAAVCGVLSGPFARYGARAIWLLPAAAFIMLLGIEGYGGIEKRGTSTPPAIPCAT